MGSAICNQLISLGYRVRVLSRQKQLVIKDVEIFNGDIINEKDVEVFLQNAQLCFHCAAELKDKSRMWEVNVRGAENILKYSQKFGINYFCYISSVGVIGKTSFKLVDELTPCNPQNTYEKTKWLAEQAVARGIRGCKVIILRPTMIINEMELKNLIFHKRRSFIDFLKVFVKGGECMHIVHPIDVAAAAVYFIPYPLEAPQCYIVSCDYEPFNTLAEIWGVRDIIGKKKTIKDLKPSLHLALFVPHFLRKIIGRKCNMGDVRYSSRKLMREGFTFKFSMSNMISQILDNYND